MKYRYVIALNHMLLTEERMLDKNQPNYTKADLKNDEVEELMNYVRKYPRQKIQMSKMFTCGFSRN